MEQLLFGGRNYRPQKQIKEDVGVVFDGINFYETLTPAKVGKIAGAAYKQWDGHLFQDYLKRFQLPADKEIKSLSKGMKMKLCIYQLLTMLGVALTDQIVFILLCCSPLLALAWCYVMYQISYRIFVKQEL